MQLCCLFTQIISSVNIFYYIYLLVFTVHVCACVIWQGEVRWQFQQPLSSFPWSSHVLKIQALGPPGTSTFTCWAIFLASTSSFMKCLKPLSFLRRCHLLSVLFVFSKQNCTDVKISAPFLGKGDGESEGGPETQGGRQCRKAWSSELGAPADRGMGPFLSSQKDR